MFCAPVFCLIQWFFSLHKSSSCSWRVRRFAVPWSSRWSWTLHLFLGLPIFLRPFGLYCSVWFGSLFVSILCTLCRQILHRVHKGYGRVTLGNAAKTAADGREGKGESPAPWICAHSAKGAHPYRKACRSRGIKVAAPPLLTVRRAGNLSRGHQDTRLILKRKKRTDSILLYNINKEMHIF